ncbi:MAG: hypothetical protein K0S49_1500, partial [Microbacterium sp.]|nr:hypothetical protein [Microbacterium sp.]
MRQVTTSLSDLRSFAAGAGSWLRHRPVTLLIAILTIGLSVAGLIFEPIDWGFIPAQDAGGAGAATRHWWSSVTSLFVVETVPALIVFVVLVLVVVGAAERAMGSVRTVIAYLVGGVAASFLGFAIDLFEQTYLAGIPLNAPAVDVFSPTAPLLATAMAASSFFGTIWRRRTRLLGVLSAVTLYLYSGGANDLFSLLAVPVGFALGFALGGRSSGFRLVRSSYYEKRVLLAAIVAITAIGPVVATASGSGAGLLSIYGYLSIDPLSIVDGQVCAFGSAGAPCPDDFSSISDLQGWSSVVALLPLVVLLLAARGIRNGRRIALEVAVAINLAIFAGMLYTFFVIEPDTVAAIGEAVNAETADFVWQTLTGVIVGAIVPLAVAIVLIVFRGAARVTTTAAAKRTFILTIVIGTAATLVVSFVGTLVIADGFQPGVDALMVLRALPLRLVPPTLIPSDIIEFVPESGAAQAMWYLPSLVFWLILVVAVARVLVDSRTVL